MPALSSISRGGALAALLLTAGCVGDAPALPPDTTSVNHTHELSFADFTKEDAAMSCDAIEEERQKNAATMKTDNGHIDDNRGRDQGVMFAGSLLGVVGLAATAPFVANTNDPERSDIARLYQRQDTLIKLAAVKHCPAAQ